MLILGLCFVLLAMGIFGFLYAWVIYKTPIDRTWLEVVYGVGGTIIGIMTGQGLLYLHYGYIPWWGILLVPLGFVITGSSQIVLQEMKFRQQIGKGNDIQVKHTNGDDD